MATLPQEMKQSDLMHQLVLDRDTLETIGRVDQLWMYPKQHRVLGLVCNSYLLKGRKSVFKLSQVQSLGSNGILMIGEGQDTDAQTVRQLETLVDGELWSEAGDRIGKIVDFSFYLNNGYIRSYLWVPSRLSQLTGDLYELPPDEVIGVGNQRVLVTEEMVRNPIPAPEGLRQKLKKAKTELKEEYSQLTHGVQSWLQQAQSLALKTKEQAQTWVHQAAEFEFPDLDFDFDLEPPNDSQSARSSRPQEFEEDVFTNWDMEPELESEQPNQPDVTSKPETSEQDTPEHQQPDPAVAHEPATARESSLETAAFDAQAVQDCADLNSGVWDEADAEDPAEATLAEDWLMDEEEAKLLATIPEEDLADDQPWI